METIKDVKRPICPNCNEEMQIVQVSSHIETRHFWICSCVGIFWIKGIYDYESSMI